MTKKKLVCYYITILSIIFIDQASKSFLISYLKTQPSYILEILPMLDFVYAWNYGISFGMFREYYQYSNKIFFVANSLIIAYLCKFAFQAKTCCMRMSLTFIIGGAVGNLIDRIYRGAVFDFLHFHYQGMSFPVFNIADSFITIGACCYIYCYFFVSNPSVEN